ncbi:MAG: bifunctional biotin--[acetyl-CoA-carboxylase] ligase/biotin operon repressor BirA [Neptuniibacter sp.]
MTVRSLLSILADGRFHSGSELGETLGISRSAIWKHIRRLEEAGIEIYSVKGRGYRIPGGLDLLDLDQMRAGLREEIKSKIGICSLELITESTNGLAMQACQQGNCHGALYLAEQQTAGRGRRGREWVSPFARNLYFSLVWRFEQGIGALEGLSLVVGLSLVKAIENLGIQGVKVKWPNDLLFDEKKLAGILVEVNGEASGQCQVVIGVGLNVDMSDQGADKIDQPWVDLKSIADAPAERNKILAEVLNELVSGLERFEDQGFAPMVAEWQSYNAHQEQEVALQVGKGTVTGVCKGVDPSGALLLETENGREIFFGGEVSLRRTL